MFFFYYNIGVDYKEVGKPATECFDRDTKSLSLVGVKVKKDLGSNASNGQKTELKERGKR